MTLFAAAPLVSHAQEQVATRGRRLEVAGGVAALSLRDEAASPLRYDGAAPLLQLGYTALRERSRFSLRGGVAYGSHTAATSGGGLPSETDVHGWIEADYLRALGTGTGRWRWAAGGTAAFRLAARNHSYANPIGTTLWYGFASVSLAPAVELERPFGDRRMLAAALAVPLVALVSRPYSDAQVFRYGVPVRAVLVGRLQAANLSVRYATPVAPRADLVLGYRLVVERLRDLQPYRWASQSVWVAVSFRREGAGSREAQ